MKNILIPLVAILVSLFPASAQIGFQDHLIIENEFAANDLEAIYVTDLDNDSDMDILSASADDNKIAWYENLDGEGTYSVQQIISTDAVKALSVFSADLDGDGDMDVLSASKDDDKIAWYENLDGTGNFSVQQIISTDADGAQAVFSADLDGDGDMDVLSSSSIDHKIAWYENMDGSGGFGAQQIIAPDIYGATTISCVDIDGDGDQDIISLSTFNDKIIWYENIDGQGNFGAEQIVSSAVDWPDSVFAADLDGDNDYDIISGTFLDGIIAWYENMDGLGNFGVQQVISTDEFGLSTVFGADLDGDNDQDILVTNYGDDRIAWHENLNGQGDFSPQQIITNQANGARAVFAAKIDGDSDVDVVSGSFLDAKIAWYENLDGGGSFGPGHQITPTIIDKPTAPHLYDMDGDGDLDVLTGSYNGTELFWFENSDGLGNFDLHSTVSAGDFTNLTQIETSDLDSDEDLDIIASTFNGDKLVWYQNIDGFGNFGPQQIISNTINAPRSSLGADMDGDGDKDVVTVSHDSIIWFANIDGLGDFLQQQTVAINAETFTNICIGDVDMDGDLDLFSASYSDDKIAWYENVDGLGNFGSQQVITTNAAGANTVFVADLDGDGDLDVLSASNSGSVGSGDPVDKIAWYENLNGQGDFGPQQIIIINADGFRDVSVTDIDLDGDLDVLSSSQVSYSSSEVDKIAWYENTDGLGVFGSQQIIASSLEDYGDLAHGDIDGDGDIDILSVTFNDDKVVWFENLNQINNQIRGTVRLDVNSNGCDNLDLTVPDLMVLTNDGTSDLATFTLSNGFYQFFVDEGTYETSITSALPNYYSLNPNFQVSSLSGIGNIDTVDFCLESNQLVNDLNINIVPTTPARPGIEATYKLIYHNAGTTQLSGNIVLEYEEAKLSFLLASEPIASQNNNTITFDFIDLNAFETRIIDLTFFVFEPPTVSIGDILNFVATIYPVIGDEVENDNVIAFNQTVTDSYDPNDITVIEGEQILLENTDKYLHYFIRFQNTGTAEAINIRVHNSLDAKLDWQTFQLENYSHDNRIEIKDGNEVDFIFNGIYLPDSIANESESHGFIAYKIKPKPDIAIGDIIYNKADIYFDFNDAVETNTVSTEVVEFSNTPEVNSSSFTIYPIPTKDKLFVDSKTNSVRIEIYDYLGVQVLSNTNKNEIDIKVLPVGIYICRVKNENGILNIQKVIKQ